MDINSIIILVLIGLFVSIICSMVGLGGGVLFIPILILGFKMNPEVAIGTSIFSMCMVTLSSTIGYARQGNVDWKLGLAYDIFDVPGIILGAYLTTVIPSAFLSIACGIMVTMLGTIIIFKKNKKKTLPKAIDFDIMTDEDYNSTVCIQLKKQKTKISSAWKGNNIKWVIISSFLGGLVTGMVGLGGGTVDTTAMVLMGVPMNIAAGSSSFAMLLTNVVGLGSHAMLSNIMWEFAIPMGLAALVGAQIGSSLATKVNRDILKKILGGVALLTGVRLFMSFVW